MLQQKELDKLMEILNNKDDILGDIEKLFISIFNDGLLCFKACYAIANLINLNVIVILQKQLLTSRQRIIALFLLMENCMAQGIKKHPFGGTILDVCAKTTESFEKKMIQQIIIDQKIEKYKKLKVDILYQQEQIMIQQRQENKKIKLLRQQFILNLPKISQNKKSQVYNILNDFRQKDKKYQPPQFEIDKNTIKFDQINHIGMNVGFMRPIPKILNIQPSQFNWLSPGIINDVIWDNTAEIDKKLSKAKTLIKKGMSHHLNKDQNIQIDRALEFQPYAVLNLGINPANLNYLIKNNPFIAVSFLAKLSNYPIIADYLQSILQSKVSINSIDVISRLIKTAKIPKQFLQSYTLSIMKESQTIPQNHKDYIKIPRIIATFIKSLLKNKQLNLNNYQQQLQQFINCFIDIQEIQLLKKIINKQ